mmetsp:Transcript_44184/g.94114  ORF Transcript_44184/g.94114 Transcript_44184/m.94114 type:complete len:151 (-) Transcript_44184:103-555(-)
MHSARWLVATAAGSTMLQSVSNKQPRETIGTRQVVHCHEETSWPSFSQLDKLWATLMERKAHGDKNSWTLRLLNKGPDKCAQKVGEEATEVVIEAAARRKEGVIKESADLIYHLLVLWASLGVEPHEVLDELARREGVSGVTEKQSRPKG